MSHYLPNIGQWFQDLSNRQLFEVVALDRDSGTIQIQYVDGEITDMEVENWGDLLLTPAAEPEDWRTAFELDEEFSGDPDAALHPTQWASPLSRIEPDTVLGIEDL